MPRCSHHIAAEDYYIALWLRRSHHSITASQRIWLLYLLQQIMYSRNNFICDNCQLYSAQDCCVVGPADRHHQQLGRAELGQRSLSRLRVQLLRYDAFLRSPSILDLCWRAIARVARIRCVGAVVNSRTRCGGLAVLVRY